MINRITTFAPENYSERQTFGYSLPIALMEQQKELILLGRHPGRLYVHVWKSLRNAAEEGIYHTWLRPEAISRMARIPLHRLNYAQNACIRAKLLVIAETDQTPRHGMQRYTLGPHAIPHTGKCGFEYMNVTNHKETSINV